MRNGLPFTVFDTGTLNGFKGAVKRWLLSSVVFFIFRGAGACGVAKAIDKQFCFSHLGLYAGFNNNNNLYALVMCVPVFRSVGALFVGVVRV